MLKKLVSVGKRIENIKNREVYSIEPYVGMLSEINQLNYEGYGDEELILMSDCLKKKARAGVSLDELLVEAFALVREVAKRVVGMKPYDVQVMTAIALHQGRVVEMQTGEGKTLSAVMTAYLNALQGKGVHVLTFNDYLAGRDAAWMGPIYEFLGLSCGCLQEDMELEERKKAYLKDITYVTAKEAGFDYLKDFLATEQKDLVHRSFNFAIVDEADSILIDEARIPLVIAGNVSEEAIDYQQLVQVVRSLEAGVDYEIDQYQNNVSLTDGGLIKVEEMIGCGNLYDSKNLQILTRLNCVLYAEVLLRKEVDYILRNGKVEIVDEFTGRVADKRHWPDNLHQAVEAKEGIVSESKGRIMGSISLQYFLKLYPKMAGMTGTAVAAKSELEEMYQLQVVAMPTNKPCIRKDHPDMIFTHKEAKHEALVDEIKRIHAVGQPILIGTSSVEESEWLEEQLKKEGIDCNVLNAKNDWEEAKIIRGAGRYKAVTVSTNMAGRGIDIKLGGEEELEKEKVVETGGLYVIGTGRHESSRIDQQLKGRAGRQGDPGESRFFISLEDDLVKKYNIDNLIPKSQYPKKQSKPLENPIIGKKIQSGQRILEGYNAEIRRQLWEYSFMLEKQRRIIHEKRLDVLMGKIPLTLLQNKSPELYRRYKTKVGEGVLKKVEKQITLYHINKCWADYLEYVSYIREGIHLVVIGGEEPLYQYNIQIVSAFDKMLEGIEKEIIDTFTKVTITKEGIDLEKEGLTGPASTWTYLVSDRPDQFSRLPAIVQTIDNYVRGTVFSIGAIYKKIKNKFRGTSED